MCAPDTLALQTQFPQFARVKLLDVSQSLFGNVGKEVSGGTNQHYNSTAIHEGLQGLHSMSDLTCLQCHLKQFITVPLPLSSQCEIFPLRCPQRQTAGFTTACYTRFVPCDIMLLLLLCTAS